MQTQLIHASASIEPSTKVPTFTATFYTGGKMNIAGYELPVVIDLAGLTRGNVLVANLDHDPSKRVGNFDVTNDGKKLVAHGTATAKTAARDEVIGSALEGYQWQASLEVNPQQIETLAKGKTAIVNGQTVTGPAYITRKGTLKGFAFVSHGADDNTTVAIAAKHLRGNAMKNSPDFPSWMAEYFPHIDTNLMTAKELANWHATWLGRPGPPIAADFEATAPMVYASSDPVAMEKRRLKQIEAACEGDEWGEYTDQIGELRAQAIEGSLTIDELIEKTRHISAEIRRSKIPMATGIAPSRRRDHQPAVMAAALALSSNLPNVEKHFDERILEAAHSSYRGFGLHHLLLAAASQNGYIARPGEGVSAGNLRTVLEYAFPPQHASTGFSYLNTSGILSNIGTKALLQGWTEGDVSWRQVAQIKAVRDFKQHTSYRLLDSLAYEEVGPGGEIKHGTASEESYSRQARTYGSMLTITRTDLINDDLSAFDDLRVRIGRGALTKFNQIFWAAFLNNSTFFSSGNANVSTGGGSALDAAGVGLQAAVLKFRQLKSGDEKSVDGEPVILLCPPELEFVARRLYQSTNVAITGSTDASAVTANIYGGLYRPIIQNRLSDSAYTGYSTAAWYLLRDPAVAAVVAVSFLNGQENPTVETAAADFNTLGIQIRGVHDFGCDRTCDYLAGIRSAGS